MLPDRANKSDEEKLIRLLKYLKGTTDLGMILGGDENNELNLEAFADASYGIHADAKSHTGLYITLGRGPILWKRGASWEIVSREIVSRKISK